MSSKNAFWARTPWLATAVAWLWLFSPPLWMAASARGAADMLASALLCAACLAWRWSTRLGAALLWLAGASALGYFLSVHSALDEYFWHALLDTHGGEALEFAQSLRTADLLRWCAWALPAATAVGWLWRRSPALARGWPRRLAWALAALWLLWAGVSAAKGYSLQKSVSRVERVYPMAMAESYLHYQESSAALYRSPEVAPPAFAPLADVIVVVLGESASAQRWSLLGYQGNDTNAALQPWRSQLVALPATANGNNTGKTLPVLMTGRRMDPLPPEGAASFLDWARAAGFRRDSFANQQAPGFANVTLHRGSDVFTKLPNGSMDGELTPLLAQSLAQKRGPLLVTLHLYGSHPRVEKRTPAANARWSDPYDNSIAYTSELLAAWIAQLDALPGVRAALVYASDHGQDFPACGGSYTHGVTRSTYEVPLLLWANAALRAQSSAWWHALQAQQRTAVSGAGLPTHNTLLFGEWLQQLLGQQSPVAQADADATSGSYPPPPSPQSCADWNHAVLQLHPAAVR